MKNIFIILALFYGLALAQTSFLAHFTLWDYFPNFILIAVILLNIFNHDIKFGITTAVIGGFFLDIFDGNFIGFWILILLAVAVFIHFVLKNYVRIPFTART